MTQLVSFGGRELLILVAAAWPSAVAGLLALSAVAGLVAGLVSECCGC